MNNITKLRSSSKRRLLFVKITIIILLFSMSRLVAQTAEHPDDGIGIPSDPFQIANISNLYWIYYSNMLDKHYIQIANIDASGTSSWLGGQGFPPIGNAGSQFTGSYNGQGYTIDGLFINKPTVDGIGLFGWIQGATIQNICVTNVNVTGQYGTGGLIGLPTGNSIIQNCFSTGSVSGVMNIGGLVGTNDNATISNCYSTCTVNSTTFNYLGGLVGENRATIINCYSIGLVTGYEYYCGGLVGAQSSGNTENSFWDSQTSGQSSSAAGTGKTTAEMKNVATFTDETTAGLTTAWDFETNPYDDIADNNNWDIDQSGAINNGYPFLSWQNGDDISLPVELSSFTARSGDGKVVLNWTTQSEKDNLGFIIMRCKNDDNEFTELASHETNNNLKGQGNSSSAKNYTFIDKAVFGGVTYRYKLIDESFNGVLTDNGEVSVTVLVFGEDGQQVEGIRDYELYSNYPNPFNPVTTVSFDISGSDMMEVNLVVYNVSGQLVSTLFSGNLEGNKRYYFEWNGQNSDGKLMPSGVYFYSLSTNEFIKVRKMTLIK